MWFVQFFSIFQDGFGYLWPLNFYVNFRINLSMSINKPDGIFGGIVLNWRRHWQPTPVLLPGNFHGRRSLVGCSPWGHWESDMTEQLHFHFSLSCIGEGNGNPLQCSCLENPHGQRSLAGSWDRKESDITKRLRTTQCMILICWLNYSYFSNALPVW